MEEEEAAPGLGPQQGGQPSQRLVLEAVDIEGRPSKLRRSAQPPGQGSQPASQLLGPSTACRFQELPRQRAPGRALWAVRVRGGGQRRRQERGGARAGRRQRRGAGGQPAAAAAAVLLQRAESKFLERSSVQAAA